MRTSEVERESYSLVDSAESGACTHHLFRSLVGSEAADNIFRDHSIWKVVSCGREKKREEGRGLLRGPKVYFTTQL